MVIRTVAVLGASGNLGKEVVNALLAAKFTVTAISRETSDASFPAGVAVRKADLSSVKSLKAAFEGQDAVVSTIAMVALMGGEQKTHIDAAISAGVKRFIPSEFGFDTPNITYTVLANLLKAKTTAVDYAIEQSKSNPGFTWTGVCTGFFLDWCLTYEVLGFSPSKKAATIYDSGNEPFPTASLPFIGLTVAHVLQHEAETANKYLLVPEFTITQNQLLKALEEQTNSQFTVTRVQTQELEKIGLEKMGKGDSSGFVEILRFYAFKDGRAHAFPEGQLANEMLELPTSELGKWIQGYIQSLAS